MTRAQVLRFLRDCQRTHAKWVKHYEKYPSEERHHAEVAGSKKSHRKLVEQYEAAITFIKEST